MIEIVNSARTLADRIKGGVYHSDEVSDMMQLMSDHIERQYWALEWLWDEYAIAESRFDHIADDRCGHASAYAHNIAAEMHAVRGQVVDGDHAHAKALEDF